jgi:hypothetical protein
MIASAQGDGLAPCYPDGSLCCDRRRNISSHLYYVLSRNITPEPWGGQDPRWVRASEHAHRCRALAGPAGLAVPASGGAVLVGEAAAGSGPPWVFSDVIEMYSYHVERRLETGWTLGRT